MDRLREPHTSDCHAFLNSESFAQYANAFPKAYVGACARVNLDPLDRLQWPLEWDKVGRFCQEFWELLPESSEIRYGAFFKLCDFAEDWCFGDHGV
jgi:hypothetical protein